MTTRWWVLVRRVYRILAGDHAYDVYRAHWLAHHAGQGGSPLSRGDFFRERTLRKWRGIQRCC